VTSISLWTTLTVFNHCKFHTVRLVVQNVVQQRGLATAKEPGEDRNRNDALGFLAVGHGGDYSWEAFDAILDRRTCTKPKVFVITKLTLLW
jgi:hypothetical protein